MLSLLVAVVVVPGVVVSVVVVVDVVVPVEASVDVLVVVDVVPLLLDDELELVVVAVVDPVMATILSLYHSP